MGDFFKPWRRRIGVVTLVMACVFAVGWVRSQARIDEMDIPVKGGTVVYKAISAAAGLGFTWVTFTGESDWKSIQFVSTPIPVEGFRSELTSWFTNECECHWDWAGFYFETCNFPKHRDVYFTIPYWSIVIPLTLLSAFLLLSKPRIAKPKRIIENVVPD